MGPISKMHTTCCKQQYNRTCCMLDFDSEVLSVASFGWINIDVAELNGKQEPAKGQVSNNFGGSSLSSSAEVCVVYWDYSELKRLKRY